MTAGVQSLCMVAGAQQQFGMLYWGVQSGVQSGEVVVTVLLTGSSAVTGSLCCCTNADIVLLCSTAAELEGRVVRPKDIMLQQRADATVQNNALTQVEHHTAADCTKAAAGITSNALMCPQQQQ